MSPKSFERITGYGLGGWKPSPQRSDSGETVVKRRSRPPQWNIEPAVINRVSRLSEEELMEWLETHLNVISAHVPEFRRGRSPYALEEVKTTAQVMYALADELLRRLDGVQGGPKRARQLLP